MERQLNRRRFLGAAAGTGAAATFGMIAPAAQAKRGRSSDSDSGHGRGHGRGRSGRVPRDRIGMQLYSMRRIMGRSQQDAANMLHTLGRMGYTEVETAGHYGWTAQEFKAVLRRAGLRAPSGHDGFDINPANTNWQPAYRQTLEYAAELGQKYTGLAWFPPPYNVESRYRFLAQRFNEAGAIAREYGLQFFYHNHDFEFSNKQANGEPMYNIFLEETDSRLVKFELDLFWIVEGGANPVEYLSADPARYPLYHVKDHVWGDRRKADGSDEADWEDVGPGMLDFPDLFEAGDGRRLDKHFIVEHDWPMLSHPGDEQAEYKTAQAGVDYLRRVRW